MKPFSLPAAYLVVLGMVAWPFLYAMAEPAMNALRYEETDPAVAYSHNWISDSAYGPWSGGSAKYTVDKDTYVSFQFTGTEVTWVGYRGRYGGVVLVFLDGALTAMLDTYSTSEQVSVPLYTIRGLAREPHTLMIRMTGMKHAQAVNSETAVDAFDVVP